MQFFHSFRFLALSALLALSVCTKAQTLHSLLVASGGAYSDPNDFVELTLFDPVTQTSSAIGTVFTQSVQDVAVHDGIAYVTAQDTLASFRIDQAQKLAVKYVSGPNQLCVHKNNLFVSFQFPETSDFLKMYDKTTLELVSTISEISNEAAYMLVVDELLYVAVPGGWDSDRGKLAVVDAVSGTFVMEYDLGTEAAGISSLFKYDTKIVAVCKTPYQGESGSVLLFDTQTNSYEVYAFDHVIGKGIGIYENKLYLFLDEGIGTIDLNTMTVSAQLVDDPGTASYIYFVEGTLDLASGRIYATITDYFSFGNGYIYDLEGNEIGNFEAGIAAEAITLNTDSGVAVPEYELSEIVIYPNPASEFIVVASEQNEPVQIQIFDCLGRCVMQQAVQTNAHIELPKLPSGVYFVNLSEKMKTMQSKIVIK